MQDTKRRNHRLVTKNQEIVIGLNAIYTKSTAWTSRTKWSCSLSSSSIQLVHQESISIHPCRGYIIIIIATRCYYHRLACNSLIEVICGLPRTLSLKYTTHLKRHLILINCHSWWDFFLPLYLNADFSSAFFWVFFFSYFERRQFMANY